MSYKVKKEEKLPNVIMITMVKDECDIVEDWVLYHGNLFGFENLYIIDNYSSDGTWEILNKFNNIHLFRKKNYKKKGAYMREIAIQYGEKYDFIYPIDIDEFVVFYDKQTKKINTDKYYILNYMKNLEINRRCYKTNYIFSLLTHPNGYNKAVSECEYGSYSDYGNFAKTFFNNQSFFQTKMIDHGNHMVDMPYIETNLCLVHYHSRNLEQFIKKNKNNIEGLGYTDTIEGLKNVLAENPNCPGNHHVKNRIEILEGTYILPITSILTSEARLYICLKSMKELINKLRK
jgi:hypothetical protein